jgi:hypothetical protein
MAYYPLNLRLRKLKNFSSSSEIGDKVNVIISPLRENTEIPYAEIYLAKIVNN